MSEVDLLHEIPFEVLPHEHGMRVDVFLSRRLTRMSRSLAARLVRTKRVWKLDSSGELKASHRVFEGETIVMKRRKLEEAPTDDIIVPIVYNDDHLVAVSKPGNLVVHPTASHYHRTLIRIMRTRLEDENLDLAHRIDKETSGLILIAKYFETSSHIKKQFAERIVQKAYLAIVDGQPEEDEFTIKVPMRLADSISKVVMEVVEPEDDGAQPSYTEFSVLGRGEGCALVECRPKTGRQHQLRVHLMHEGHPIIGDKLYMHGEDYFLKAVKHDYDVEALLEEVGHFRQALHAWKARFKHPISEEWMTLAAPMPEDMRTLAIERGIDLTRMEERAKLDLSGKTSG